jgi:hypothetical protein
LQGNSLLKDGQFAGAAERYIKSLTHIQKMFDLNPEQTKVLHPRPSRRALRIAFCVLHLVCVFVLKFTVMKFTVLMFTAAPGQQGAGPLLPPQPCNVLHQA